MNFTVQSQHDGVAFESWPSSRRRARGVVVAGAVMAIAGTLLYVRYSIAPLPELGGTGGAGVLVGIGLARVLTDFGMRERVVLSRRSAGRELRLLDVRLKKENCELVNPPVIGLTREGLQLVGTSVRFGKYLDTDDATVAIAEINRVLESAQGCE